MAYIFMDESGDLGFDKAKKRTSKTFVITFLFSKSRRPIEKVIKKVFSKLPLKVKKTHPGCLHATKENTKTRTGLLNALSKLDISVLSITLNKDKVYTKFQNEKHLLYNYVTNILLDRIIRKKIIPTNEPINLVASQRETNVFLNSNFKSYLSSQVKNNHKLDIDITVTPSHGDKCLQAVDFICWAIYRKLESGDPIYYNLIKSKILENNKLFA